MKGRDLKYCTTSRLFFLNRGCPIRAHASSRKGGIALQLVLGSFSSTHSVSACAPGPDFRTRYNTIPQMVEGLTIPRASGPESFARRNIRNEVLPFLA